VRGANPEAEIHIAVVVLVGAIGATGAVAVPMVMVALGVIMNVADAVLPLLSVTVTACTPPT
jgi:hypothetical protein